MGKEMKEPVGPGGKETITHRSSRGCWSCASGFGLRRPTLTHSHGGEKLGGSREGDVSRLREAA